MCGLPAYFTCAVCGSSNRKVVKFNNNDLMTIAGVFGDFPSIERF